MLLTAADDAGSVRVRERETPSSGVSAIGSLGACEHRQWAVRCARAAVKKAAGKDTKGASKRARATPAGTL